MSIDKIETGDREHNYDNVPFFSSSEHYLEIQMEGVDKDIAGTPVDEGDFVGYQEDGSLVVVKGAPGPTTQPFDRFAKETSEELDMEIGAYLSGPSSEHSDAMTGEEIYDLAERVLDNSPDLKVSNELGYHGVAPVDMQVT